MIIKKCKNCDKRYIGFLGSPALKNNLCYPCSWGGQWKAIDKEPYMIWLGTKKDLLIHISEK